MTDTEIEEQRQRGLWLNKALRFVVLPAMAGDVERPIVPTNQLSSGATTDFRRPKMESSTAIFDEAMATDAELQKHFSSTPALQDEFSDGQAYLAFVKHERGRPIEERQAEHIHQLEAKLSAQREAVQLQEWVSLTHNQLRRLYATSPDLQNEFSSADAFIALVRAEERRPSIPVALLVAS